MAEQHRATADEWASVKALASGGVAYSTILELLHRIEALEAAVDRAASEAYRAPSTEPRPSEVAAAIRAAAHARAKSNHPGIPDSSLVERVADAIVTKATSAGIVDDRPARAAIRAVTAWLTSNPNHHFPPALVFALEQEAER